MSDYWKETALGLLGPGDLFPRPRITSRFEPTPALPEPPPELQERDGASDEAAEGA